MIELEQLQEMFASIAEGAKWDMSAPMLWGYFLTDESREKLESLVPGLERQGYRVVDIFEGAPDDAIDVDDDSAATEDEDDEPGEYFYLHVEKEEIHTPESLHARNAEFYALAEEHDLLSYDGMDVGPIDATH